VPGSDHMNIPYLEETQGRIARFLTTQFAEPVETAREDGAAIAAAAEVAVAQAGVGAPVSTTLGTGPIVVEPVSVPAAPVVPSRLRHDAAAGYPAGCLTFFVSSQTSFLRRQEPKFKEPSTVQTGSRLRRDDVAICALFVHTRRSPNVITPAKICGFQ
jgi:hypothetical protein